MRQLIKSKIEEYLKGKDFNQKKFDLDIKYSPSLEEEIWLVLKSFANDMRYRKLISEWLPVIETFKPFISLESIDKSSGVSYFSQLKEVPGLMLATLLVFKKDINKCLFSNKSVLSMDSLSSNEKLPYFIFTQYFKNIIKKAEEDKIDSTYFSEEDIWTNIVLEILNTNNLSDNNHFLQYIWHYQIVLDMLLGDNNTVNNTIRNKLEKYEKNIEDFPIHRDLVVTYMEKEVPFGWTNNYLFLLNFLEKNTYIIEKIKLPVENKIFTDKAKINVNFMEKEIFQKIDDINKVVEKRKIKMQDTIRRYSRAGVSINSSLKKQIKELENSMEILTSWYVFIEKNTVRLKVNKSSLSVSSVSKRNRL